MTSFDVWFPAFAGTLSGSRLASRFAGLGRDDYLRRNHLGKDGNSSTKGFMAGAVARPMGGSLKDNF